MPPPVRSRPQSCLLDKAPKGGSCTSAPLLAGAAASAITPDGKTLIVASSRGPGARAVRPQRRHRRAHACGLRQAPGPAGRRRGRRRGGGLRGRGGRRGGAGRLHAGEGALLPARGRRLRPTAAASSPSAATRWPRSGATPPRASSRRPAARRPISATSRARRRATLFEPRGHRGVVRRALALRDQRRARTRSRCSPPRWRSRAAPRRRTGAGASASSSPARPRA